MGAQSSTDLKKIQIKVFNGEESLTTEITWWQFRDAIQPGNLLLNIVRELDQQLCSPANAKGKTLVEEQERKALR